jgi:hypothetical protein
MTALIEKPWVKYPLMGVLVGYGTYGLMKPAKSAKIVGAVLAVVVPIGVYFGSKAFSKWEPSSSSTPFLNETLVPIAAPKMPSSLPEGFDPVKASFFKGQTTGKLYASTEISQGDYTTAQWWVR